MTPLRTTVLMAMLVGAGCAAPRSSLTQRITVSPPPSTQPTPPTAATTTPATMPSRQALMTLDEIEPRPVLPATRPTTQQATAPLEAIEIYAQARDLMLRNQRYTAINLIQKAIQLDPGSFELQYALGRAYQEIGSGERSAAAYEKAAELRPDHLDVQLELGRAYQSRNEISKAIERYRLARQTTAYKADDASASVVDYRLAVALEQQGYTRASLECYKHLLERMEYRVAIGRPAPEIIMLMTRPELLYTQIGELHEVLGEYREAQQALEQVAKMAPNNFEPQARIVRVMLKAGDQKAALAKAEELVKRFHASVDSIELLREVHRAGNSPAAFVDALRALQRENPQERAILFALADTLAADGNIDEARGLLEKSIELHHGEVEIVERLYKIYSDRDRVTDAARLIIEVTAAHPGTTAELQAPFLDLGRLSRKNALRLAALEKIQVSPAAEAAKQYWLWRVATVWTRPAAARAALAAASGAAKPFDPAARAQIELIADRNDGDLAVQKQLADTYIATIASRGRPDLAEELRGLLALHNEKADEAANHFANAIRLSEPGTPSPDLQLEYAIALLRQGNSPRFEQLMWKLLKDRPRYDSAYMLLLNYYRQTNSDTQSQNVINTWLSADPNSVAARLQQATSLLEQRRADEALALVRRLFDQRPDDSDVVTSLVVLLNAAGQGQQAIDLLEAERQKRPFNRVAVEALVEVYSSQNKRTEATRVIDAARAAVANDADLLYYVAHLYQRIEQPETTEVVLQDVLKLDPQNAAAGNDLGYTWADAGKNIEQAEALIRIAVNAEPDNPSYLDSLGWVLYKQGRFQEASKLLEQAADPVDSADPVVLDHLGDALYRLERAAEARRIWEQALERIGETNPRPDTNELRLQLQAKLDQSKAGQPVKVAPIVDAAAPKAQAKN